MNDFFQDIIYLESIDSTNTFLKANDYKDKTIVYTFNQTKGRGRNQRKWSDFKDKNLALSFLLKTGQNFNHNLWYIATTSLALLDILDKYNIKESWIKWPNDVYINDEKLAGVLAESVWKSMKIDKLVVGIGINVNCNQNDLSLLDNKATSFLIQTDTYFDMHDFFNVYKEKLSNWLSLLYTKKGINIIRKRWIKSSKILNKRVEWHDGKGIIKGTITNVELDGTLLLETDKEKFKIISGEIKVIQS